MINESPAFQQAGELASEFGLENHGLYGLGTVYWNQPREALYEEAVCRGEARISRDGPLVVRSGKHTARAAGDKFLVREPSTEDEIWWGSYNRPISQNTFDSIYGRLMGYLQGRDVFVQDAFLAHQEETAPDPYYSYAESFGRKHGNFSKPGFMGSI